VKKAPPPSPATSATFCRSISTGEDVDVLEIDGASNRGIDEIRQLRQNVGVRPSRSRFKIYIIDEVHMLTREAFNALAEDPGRAAGTRQVHLLHHRADEDPHHNPLALPAFRFCGHSDPVDFRAAAADRGGEGVEADPDALEVLARRAAGSMRDSQSLLEQLLAFAPGRITVADVHGMLGTAGEERLASLVGHLIERNPAGALADLDNALNAGVDAPQLIEQLFGYLRDCMVVAVGCPSEALLYTRPPGPNRWPRQAAASVWTPFWRSCRFSTRPFRGCATARKGGSWPNWPLVRISHLEDLDELSEVISRLQTQPGGGEVPAAAAKKKLEDVAGTPPCAVRAGCHAHAYRGHVEDAGGPTHAHDKRGHGTPPNSEWPTALRLPPRMRWKCGIGPCRGSRAWRPDQARHSTR